MNLILRNAALFVGSLYFTFFIYRFLKSIIKIHLWMIAIIFILVLFISYPAKNYLDLYAVVYYHVLVISIILELLNFILKKYQLYHILFTTGILTAILTVSLFGYGYYRINHIVKTTYHITSEKVDHLKFIEISDLHMGNAVDQTKLKKICKDISQEKADMIFLTGDFFDENTTLQQMKDACQILSTIYHTKGIYYVYGNHDSNVYSEHPAYYANDIRQEFEKNGIVVLDDEVVTVQNITIVGRSDAHFYNDSSRKTTAQLLEHQSIEQNYTIVLDHQPLDLEENATLHVDLQLSGHTHGGQLFPQRILTELTSDTLVYGKRKIGDFQAVTSSGISGWRYPIKTGAKSEYVVIEVN